MIKGGPKIVTDGLLFCLDAADIKCISKAGCVGFNNADQILKNLVSTTDSITSSSTVRLGNLTYYTIYGLTYPEGSQTPSARDGITPGFNDITSSKTLDFSRDMNYAVWDNATDSWVPDSYFNGERLAGHCYDTYDTSGNAATEHDLFQSDHAAIKSAFPDATHIVVGSHAAENNDSDSDTLAILQDLGGPASWPGDRAEYILIGKPGLGADNAYVWQYQNNSSSVAHANVGLPILGRKAAGQNYLDFNGVDDQVIIPSLGSSYSNYSLEFWIAQNGTPSGSRFYSWNAGGTFTVRYITSPQKFQFHYNPLDGSPSSASVNGNSLSDTVNGVWHHVVVTNDSSVGAIVYTDGVAGSTGEAAVALNNGHILGTGYAGVVPMKCNIASFKIYSKALTAAEVLSNYNATKGRFS